MIIIGILIIAIFSLSVIQMNKQEVVSVNAGKISNKKIGWGIKRNDNHEQPDVGATNRKILETLKNNDVKATFFITAHYVNTQEELVKQMIEEGHIVGNHTPIFLMSGNDIKVKC